METPRTTHTVHEPVKLGLPETILVQETNDTIISPVVTMLGPLNDDVGSPSTEGKAHDLHTCNPQGLKQLNMNRELLLSTGETFVDPVPRATLRAGDRHPNQQVPRRPCLGLASSFEGASEAISIR